MMNAWQPNVVGKMYENHFQNSGNASVGHEKPVRKRHTGDITRNSRNTDSLLVMSELHAIENITQSVTKNSRSNRIYQNSPLCGMLNNAGIIHAM